MVGSISEMSTDLLRDSLSGKVVLVTGGGSGIGAAIAEAFGRYGAKVGIHYYRSDFQRVSACTARICAAGGEAFPLQADLSSCAAVKKMIDQTIEHFGKLNILVNNAGSMVDRRRLEDVDDDFIDQVFNLNARSVVTACRAVLPGFIMQGGGSIINVSSISARTGGSPGSSIYSSSKAFVRESLPTMLFRSWIC